MEIKESIGDLTVQNPPGEEFSAANLTWTKFGNCEKSIDDVALIPYARLDAFITGESNNPESPTRFHIERGRKRERGSLKEFKTDEYLLYRLYWCSFGPENYGEGGSILPSRKYRLNTRNRAARPQSMRGCTCHFSIKRLYARPSVVLIIYHERRHVNKLGVICHGPLDRDAIGPGARKVPYVGSEIQQQTMSLIYLGVPEENVLQTHIEGVQRYCGSSAEVDNLASQYVQKLGLIIKRSTHELDLDDQSSIRMWVERNRKSVFFYQDSTEDEPFILGIQTEWQLQQMIRFGHESLLASDSSFGISKLKYPLYTLLVFDSRQHALPVAWVITRSITKLDVSNWMRPLIDKIHSVDSSWRVGGFIVDDPASELDPIRNVFGCPILFSLWRIRRSWMKNVVKRCSNIEVRREIASRLSKFVHGIWDDEAPMSTLEELLQDFVDQTAFMQYFRAFWFPKLGMWIEAIRALPIASLESCAAVEAHHLKLKLKVYDDSQLDALQRVDWLVHKLTTELHSSYWFDLYADESGMFPQAKQDYLLSSPWHQAIQIPDAAVFFDGNFLSATVTDADGPARTVWGPGSEFALCNCPSGEQGSLCEHMVKVNMMCDRRSELFNDGFVSAGPIGPSLSFVSFRRELQTLSERPEDGSMSMDLSVALVARMQGRIERLVDLFNAEGIDRMSSKLQLQWAGKRPRSFSGTKGGGGGSGALLGKGGKGRGQSGGTKNRKRRRVTRV